MNNINITGNICADAIIHTNSNDKKVATFTVAVRGNKEHTDFIRCTAFGGRAEYAEKYAKKGARVAVAGSLHIGNYVNKDGVRVNTAEIYVNDIEISNKAVHNEAGNAPVEVDGFVEVDDEEEELPFN